MTGVWALHDSALYDNEAMTSPTGSFNPYGAIDLAALAKQREAQERATSATSADESTAPVVVDVGDTTFEQEVVQRSMTVPVVIDFWATWCEPCKQLSPILERFADEDSGQWVLAKVDVDANPQLSSAAQVQSIPTVMVVWQGQVIPGFTGALPEAQVRDFLNQVVALAGDLPPKQEEEIEPELDPALEAADLAMQQNDLSAAAAAYEQLLQERPGDIDALRGLAQVDLLRRTEGHDLASVLAKADPTDASSQLLAADLELLAGDVQAAFDRVLALLGGLAETDGEGKEQAKSHLLALLDLVGNDDPRVLAARRSLASTLF